EVIFNESYGEVSRGQLAAYKKHNVSPSDHTELEDFYGFDHEAIRKAVLDPENHQGSSFSTYLWSKRRGDAPASPGGDDDRTIVDPKKVREEMGDLGADTSVLPDAPEKDGPTIREVANEGQLDGQLGLAGDGFDMEINE